MIATGFLIAALVLFILATVGVGEARFNLPAAGLACLTIVALITSIGV